MRLKVPVIAVLGHKSSGKTTVIEKCIRELTKKGLKVASVKHVALKGFSLDSKGKNTWRHSAAGANPVVSVSNIVAQEPSISKPTISTSNRRRVRHLFPLKNSLKKTILTNCTLFSYWFPYLIDYWRSCYV